MGKNIKTVIAECFKEVTSDMNKNKYIPFVSKEKVTGYLAMLHDRVAEAYETSCQEKDMQLAIDKKEFLAECAKTDYERSEATLQIIEDAKKISILLSADAFCHAVCKERSSFGPCSCKRRDRYMNSLNEGFDKKFSESIENYTKGKDLEIWQRIMGLK